MSMPLSRRWLAGSATPADRPPKTVLEWRNSARPYGVSRALLRHSTLPAACPAAPTGAEVVGVIHGTPAWAATAHPAT